MAEVKVDIACFRAKLSYEKRNSPNDLRWEHQAKYQVSVCGNRLERNADVFHAGTAPPSYICALQIRLVLLDERSWTYVRTAYKHHLRGTEQATTCWGY